MSISKIFFVLLIFVSSNLSAQYQIHELTAQKGVSIRSLSVPSEKVIWASGSKGMIAKSTDEGKSFVWLQVKGYENRDFRAMHAWNDQEAIIVAVSAPAIILKTKNGGASWYKVYENKDTTMFLDAIHFSDTQHGTVIGDPIDDAIFMLTTNNGGESWSKMPSNYFTTSLHKGEAFFASSNSNLIKAGQSYLLVTGGIKSRLWVDGNASDLPIIQGTNSTGANSIAVSPNQQKIVVVGGDFTKDKISDANIVGYRLLLEPKSDQKYLTQKKLILHPLKLASPNGYKSSIAFINNKLLITCGTSGVDVSTNTGKTWITISDASYHVVKKHTNKNGSFLAGSGGRIGYIQFK
jgi:photosystem II stability/assembly factor-like uncharacterized protein